VDDNVLTILQMVQDGKITAQEAQGLINAINNKQATSASNTATATSSSTATATAPAGFHSPPPDLDRAPAPPPPPRLSPGDLLLQIADDPSIPEDEKLNIIIHASALLSTVMAMQPIPGLDIFFFTPVQIASAMAMSRVMGDPLGKNGAGEIVTSVVGVVGLGIVAEQIFLLGAKIVLPIFGGIALIPLLYATSYGLGYTIRAALDARRNHQRLSDDELRRIKAEAEQRARAQKRDWSLNALKRELDEWREKGEAYKKFEIAYETQQQQTAALQKDVEQLSSQLAALQQQKMDLEGRWQTEADKLQTPDLPEEEQSRLRTELEPLSKEADDLNALWTAKGVELNRKQQDLDQQQQALLSLVRDRFQRSYPQVRFHADVVPALLRLPLPQFRVAERQIALLQFSPAKADYQGDPFLDSGGRAIRTIAFGEDGRIYVSNVGNDIAVRRVGTGLTISRDMNWLLANPL